MYFYTVIGGVPTAGDCAAAANALARWDIDGATPGTSYRLFRTSSSFIREVKARSIDPRSRAVAWAYPPLSDTEGAEGVSDALSDQVAVLARWQALPGQLRRGGRTYLPCLCHNVLDGERPDRVNDSAGPALTTCLNGLITLLAIDLDAVMVLLTSQRHGVDLRPCPVSVVYQALPPASRVATQRRRLPAR